MSTRILNQVASHLPADDEHPFRTGAWTPNTTEVTADDLEVIGEIPSDLDGVYLRNTENPVFPAIERYHPFDGDGMLHAMHFSGGRATYTNRFVQTEGLSAEIEAGRPLWAGILEHPMQSERDGWGARQRMKDASSTDVVVHRGQALTTFYQCGDAYLQDPITLEPTGRATWFGDFPSDWGVSAHTKLDELTGELLYFSYAKEAPYLKYGVVSPEGRVVHRADIPLPGPRLPHDMAFTQNYAIFNDFPVFWDPRLLPKGIHFARFDPTLPSRFAVIPRRATTDQVRWFEAKATYALHFANAYEDGEEIVLDGYPQANPMPSKEPGDGPYDLLKRYVDLRALQTHLHRWRFNLVTGETTEERLCEDITEFPSINGRFGGRPYRYIYAMTNKAGWFLFNGLRRHYLEAGEVQRYDWPDGVYASESPMAPRVNAKSEDDGYVVTFVTDMNANRSECQIFDAQDIGKGPICRVLLPHRISSGTHACWAPGTTLGRP